MVIGENPCGWCGLEGCKTHLIFNKRRKNPIISFNCSYTIMTSWFIQKLLSPARLLLAPIFQYPSQFALKDEMTKVQSFGSIQPDLIYDGKSHGRWALPTRTQKECVYKQGWMGFDCCYQISINLRAGCIYCIYSDPIEIPRAMIKARRSCTQEEGNVPFLSCIKLLVTRGSNHSRR